MRNEIVYKKRGGFKKINIKIYIKSLIVYIYNKIKLLWLNIKFQILSIKFVFLKKDKILYIEKLSDSVNISDNDLLLKYIFLC